MNLVKNTVACAAVFFDRCHPRYVWFTIFLLIFYGCLIQFDDTCLILLYQATDINITKNFNKINNKLNSIWAKLALRQGCVTMKGISNFFQHIATQALASAPCLPAIFLPLIQARNLPPANRETPQDDENQTTGRALYQLAQNMTNVTADDRQAIQQWRIKSLPQAVATGLYLTHTLDPFMANTSQASHLRGDAGDDFALGHSSPLPYHSSHASANEPQSPDDPPQPLPPENKGEVSFKFFFLPNVRPGSWDPIAIAVPVYGQPLATSPPLQLEDATPMFSPDQTNAGNGGEKSAGAGAPKKSRMEQRQKKARVSPERRFSGRVGEQAEVQLTAGEEQPQEKAPKQRTQRRMRGPVGEIPQAPSLPDFVDSALANADVPLAPEGNVPQAPLLSDFADSDPAPNDGNPAATAAGGGSMAGAAAPGVAGAVGTAGAAAVSGVGSMAAAAAPGVAGVIGTAGVAAVSGVGSIAAAAESGVMGMPGVEFESGVVDVAPRSSHPDAALAAEPDLADVQPTMKTHSDKIPSAATDIISPKVTNAVHPASLPDSKGKVKPPSKSVSVKSLLPPKAAARGKFAITPKAEQALTPAIKHISNILATDTAAKETGLAELQPGVLTPPMVAIVTGHGALVAPNGEVKSIINDAVPMNPPKQIAAGHLPSPAELPRLANGRQIANRIGILVSQNADVWLNEPTQQQQQNLIKQCEFTLADNQSGTPVLNLNPDYYDLAPIYEVQTRGA